MVAKFSRLNVGAEALAPADRPLRKRGCMAACNPFLYRKSTWPGPVIAPETVGVVGSTVLPQDPKSLTGPCISACCLCPPHPDPRASSSLYIGLPPFRRLGLPLAAPVLASGPEP